MGDDLKDNVKFLGEDVVEIYGKKYGGEVFRHFDLGSDENTYIQVISRKEDDVCVVKTIRLDCVDGNAIVDGLKKRAQQAIREFETKESFVLELLDQDIDILKLMLKINDDNTDTK
ncbi:hypothetical protein KAR91_41935 [Candidatus Pacearchaeota archaeon]|nr:hypothetical protein [Candidatus Pacearchaeota archaeon]